MLKFATVKKEILPKIAAKKVFNLIKDELELVEKEYERQANSNIQVIKYIGEYLRESGGKRVRPALLILAAKAVGDYENQDNLIRMATVMEMLHTATLVHDDIIDNAELRRNRVSVNAQFGNQTAVLMGDWLYMSAFETSLEERSLEILDILTRLTRKMTEGELIQLTALRDVNISEETYFDILVRKTAFLFSGCCEIGAILSKADADKQTALRDYGLNLGISFQIADDLLDFTSDKNSLGKAAGADLIEGKMTLPLIELAKRLPSIKPYLENIMVSGKCDEIQKKYISEQLEKFEIMKLVKARAEEYATAARKNLDILQETEYLTALDTIPYFVIDRKS